jgi:predicted acyltransferase
MSWVPVPGFGAGDFSADGNLAAYVDRMYLPGDVPERGWHPEGILGTIPAIGTCVIGLLMGEFVTNGNIGTRQKPIWLVGIGIVAMGGGFLWGDLFPVNKRMWTSSFVLVSGGWASCLLGVLYQICDVWRRQRWISPLLVYGRNPLFAYVCFPLIRFDTVAERLCGGDIATILGPIAPVCRAIIVILLGFALLYAMDRRKIYVRL